MRNGIPKKVNNRGGKSQVRPDIPSVTVRHDLLSKFADKYMVAAKFTAPVRKGKYHGYSIEEPKRGYSISKKPKPR